MRATFLEDNKAFFVHIFLEPLPEQSSSWVKSQSERQQFLKGHTQLRMSDLIRRLILTVLLIASMLSMMTDAVYALDPQKTISQYGHNVWLRQNGLPANLVNVAFHTSDGYLWLGTSAGLFRFDGVNFTNVPTNPLNPRDRETVTALCQTSDGSLWIGTIFSGLRRLSGDSMSVYGLKQGFYDTQVWSLMEDKSGHLLIGTSIGLFTFTAGGFKPILESPNYVAAVCEDSLERIWVGTHDGVFVFPESLLTDKSGSIRMQNISSKDGLPNDVTTCLLADERGGVWIGSYSGLAYWINGKISTFGMNNGLPDYHVNSIFEDRDGNIWVGTRNGLSRFNGGKWTTYNQNDGLTDNNVTSFEEDNEGSLWVGTSNGLNQFEDVNMTTYTTSEGLASNYLSSVLETQDGTLYFLSDQGASVTAMKNGETRVYNISVGPAYVSRDGSLWIGQTGVLNRIKDGILTSYKSEAGIPVKWISAITEDSRSLIIYVDHTGLFRFKNGMISPYKISSGAEYPAAEAVMCFYWQRSGDILWVGAADSLVKIEGGKITGYTTADGLAGNWNSSFYDDHQGNLWISSPQGGLTRYHDGKFTAYNTSVGLFTNSIFCVVGDNDGGLWLSSPRGVGLVSLTELNDFAARRVDSIQTKVFGVEDGMKREECFGFWQPAGWKDLHGNIWFATREGAVTFNPRKFKLNQIAPSVLVEQVVADNMAVPHHGSVVLPPGTDKLEFHYTALSLAAPDRVMFKYELVGYDNTWVDPGTRRVAYYTNLPPGEYKFRVIACNNDGIWNYSGAEFSFNLKPHFYETYWFYILMILLFCGVAFGIYRLRVWQLLAKEKELNVRIQEALANIKTLGGLIPICSNCKKIRDDKGYWEQLEGYIQSHSEAQFSHGICPDCAAKLYPDYYKSKGNEPDSSSGR